MTKIHLKLHANIFCAIARHFFHRNQMVSMRRVVVYGRMILFNLFSFQKKLFAFLARRWDLCSHFDCSPVSTLIRIGSLCLIELSLHWSRVGLHSKLIQLRFICEINFFPAVNTSGSVNIVGGRKIEWRFAYMGLHRRPSHRKHVLNGVLINSTREEIY